MQSIMANVISRFAHPVSFPSFACLVILAVVGQSIYNRYFHPLRRHPGPVWASVTDLYKLYALWAKHIPTSQLALHRRYGMLLVFQRIAMLHMLMMVKAASYVWRQTCSQSVILECFQMCIIGTPTKAISTPMESWAREPRLSRLWITMSMLYEGKLLRPRYAQ